MRERAEIIAELGASIAGEEGWQAGASLVRQAAWAGATAVKVQFFSPASMTIDHRGNYEERFLCRYWPWYGIHLWDLYKKAATTLGTIRVVADAARRAGLKLVVSVYSVDDIPKLLGYANEERFKIDALKIASFEAGDRQLIIAAAGTELPLIVSTGMATMGEIKEITFWAQSAPSLALLHCVSAYPTPIEAADLHGLMSLQTWLPEWLAATGTTRKIEVGYSDHTTSTILPAAAVGMGASIIEKHLADDGQEGLDDSFALSPVRFKEMVQAIRETEVAIGPSFVHAQQMVSLRRSLFVVRDIGAGQVFTKDNVRSIRPAGGMAPHNLPLVLGKQAASNLMAGQPLMIEDVDGFSTQIGVTVR